MPLIPFADFRPDVSDIDMSASANIINVVPRADGYGPVPSPLAATSSLPGPCRGAFLARNSDGSYAIFGATATQIYKLSGSSWVNVSNGTYPSVPPGDNWQFAQFNSLVLATQVNVGVQVFDLSTATQFSNLAGSPPQARYITLISRFVVLSGLLTFPGRAWWSDLDNPTQWTPGVGLSDFQDLPDGGVVRGIAGGDQYGTIFQDGRIRTITFAPGSPTIFDILAFPSTDGLFAFQSLINANNGTFFCSPQGFKFVPQGGLPTPIGRERVDRTFFSSVDQANLQLVQGASDPINSRVFWAFKSVATSALQFDTIFIYDWVLDKWSQISLTGQFLVPLGQPGITLDQLDTIAPGVINVLGAANNGSGAIRLTLSGLQSGLTNLRTENTVEVYGVVGTTEANGNWHFRIIDSTHIDLTGSSFVHPYVSGGAIGGAIDAMTVSLDFIQATSALRLAVVDTNAALDFFRGPNLQAIVETGAQDLMGRRAFIAGLRPMTDASAGLASIGTRDNAQQPVVYTPESPINAVGICPQRIDTRYGKGRLRIPAGASWTYAKGMEPVAQQTGLR